MLGRMGAASIYIQLAASLRPCGLMLDCAYSKDDSVFVGSLCQRNSDSTKGAVYKNIRARTQQLREVDEEEAKSVLGPLLLKVPSTSVQSA